MMSARLKQWMERITYILCILMKYNPFRHKAGIFTFGNPGPDSPVFVSGDYFQTVKRIMKVLKGRDCYLLVVDSAGINVWCGAGVGDFNEHKIADAVNASGLGTRVNHRRLILPQLAAVGIDLANLKKECGFEGIWGPANLQDIPGYMDNGLRVTEDMRHVNFTKQDVTDQAISLFIIFSLPVLFFSLFGWSNYKGHIFYVLSAIAVNIAGICAYERIGFIRYPSNKAVFVGILTFVPVFLSSLFIPDVKDHMFFCTTVILIVSLLLALDMVGSTPYYKTTMGYWLTHFSNASLFQPQINRSCGICGACVQVCPKGVLKEEEGEIIIHEGSDCCECLACVKQCPVNAISNRNATYKQDIKSIANLDFIMGNQFE